MPKTIDRSHNPSPVVFTTAQRAVVLKALVIYRSDYATHREPESLPVIAEIIKIFEEAN